ncbi:EPIDERMAL PATTERNING FACTOR-like protein 1 [Panicum virgatum]|uniref:Epidermal patterning factor-like protein n=1 Tax=Panicum virgatum TaxID=38727 RepID=A0A8T0R2H5_PANVG|nr:EPIDERMAL PATTERNING FACTOR-like protein 1 [Panicum virgatum]KAG2579470.1 hypothetical protein PVAP13_6NG287600 [Panicum virgatum]
MSERARARAHAHAHAAALASKLLPAMRPASSAARAFLSGAVFLLALLGLVLEAACLRSLQQPPTPLQGGAGGGTAAGEEKVRLGSSPPSCRGKCYECSPCTAVQVPALSTGPSGPSSAAARARTRARAAAGEVATLSNYKPVGWKCQCRDRLYEP